MITSMLSFIQFSQEINTMLRSLDDFDEVLDREARNNSSYNKKLSYVALFIISILAFLSLIYPVMNESGFFILSSDKIFLSSSMFRTGPPTIVTQDPSSITNGSNSNSKPDISNNDNNFKYPSNDKDQHGIKEQPSTDNTSKGGETAKPMDTKLPSKAPIGTPLPTKKHPTVRPTIKPIVGPYKGKYVCYDAMGHGLGHQIRMFYNLISILFLFTDNCKKMIDAIAVMLKYYGPELFRVLDPIPSAHRDVNSESYASFMDPKLVIKRTEKFNLCSQVQIGYPNSEDHVSPNAYYETTKPGYYAEVLGPFLTTAFQRHLCKNLTFPADTVGVKVRLSDVNADQRVVRNLTAHEYCRVLNLPRFAKKPCAIMSDVGKLPCRPECFYLDQYVDHATNHNSLDIMCNLKALGQFNELLTMVRSNLQWIINGEIYLQHKSDKYPKVFDIYDLRDYDIQNELRPRHNPEGSDWQFTYNNGRMV